MLTEERIIKAIVESIVAHDIDADYKSDDFGGGSEDRKAACELTQALEDSGVSVETDENDQEITHVQINGKHLSFHAGDWEWQEPQSAPVPVEDEDPYIPYEIEYPDMP